MRAFLPVGVAAACAACAPASSAQPVPARDFTDHFEAVCLATGAERAAVIAEAEKRGWPKTAAENYPAEPGQDRVVRMRGRGLATHAVFSERQRNTIAGVPTFERSCTMMATVDDPAAVMAFAKRKMAKVEFGSSDARGGMWTYAESQDGPRTIESEADAQEAVRAGRFRTLMVSGPEPTDPEGSTALKLVVSQN